MNFLLIERFPQNWGGKPLLLLSAVKVIKSIIVKKNIIVKWNNESEKEEEHIRVKIYQVNLKGDQENAAFMSRDSLQRLHGKAEINPSIYDEVFNADIEPKNLEGLFVQFNSEYHPLYRGRSMSVSDVVVIDPEGIPTFVGEITGHSPYGGDFKHRYTDLVEYNLAIETFRENDIDFEAHDMVGLNISGATAQRCERNCTSPAI